MLENERLTQIINLLKSNPTLHIRELAKQLYVSDATVRRDIRILEKEGLARHVHGGVVAVLDSRNTVISFSTREKEMAAAKWTIAKMAAALVKDNNTIFLDGTTTACVIANCLPTNRGLRVVTIGTKVAETLADRGIPVLLTGGILMGNSYTLYGMHAENTIADIHADFFFCSSRGLSLDGRLCTENYEGIAVTRMMMKHARRIYLCIPSEKIGRDYSLTHCMIDDIDGVLCDAPLPENLQRRIGANRKREE